MSLESRAANAEIEKELRSEVSEPEALWTANGWVCPSTFKTTKPSAPPPEDWDSYCIANPDHDDLYGGPFED